MKSSAVFLGKQEGASPYCAFIKSLQEFTTNIKIQKSYKGDKSN
jgi:hypothetical protein